MIPLGILGAARPRATGGDPAFASVLSLLHFDGADGATTITDVKGRAWTASGNAQLDTAESKFGGSSLLLDGSGDFVSTPSADFGFDTGAFTMESWLRPNLSADRCWLSNRAASTTGWALEARASGALWMRARVGGSWSDTFMASAAGVVTTLAWCHVAVVRSGSNWYIFHNGIIVATATNANGLDSDPTADLIIGRANSSGENSYAGHIDDLRITKGVARYTANFTPSAAAFPDS